MIGWARMLAAAGLLTAGIAAAQTIEPRRQPPVEALAQDAGTFAAQAGLVPDEALRRLTAQVATIATTDALAIEFADRLAGIVVEQRPSYRIIVHLTGDTEVPGRVVAAGGTIVPIAFQPGASATRERLLAALAMHQATIRASLRKPPGMGIDPRTGTLVVLAGQSDIDAEGAEPLAARLSAIAGVPVTVRGWGGVEADAAVEGGARLVGSNPPDPRRYICTTGFVVTDGVQDGVVTAAHCPDTLSLVAAGVPPVPLDFVGQWGWGSQDVQVHATPGPLSPHFLADAAKTLSRSVTAVAPRAATRVGDIVCHRGERTGYSCAEIELVDFAPAGDLCGGDCLPTWVAVRGPTCRGGDSGGPVFLGTTAYGIVKGGSYRTDGTCTLYYYMSLDFLPAGWRVMVEPDDLSLPTLPPGR